MSINAWIGAGAALLFLVAITLFQVWITDKLNRRKGRKRLEDLTIREMARFGHQVGLRFAFGVTPLNDTRVVPDEEYGALLQVAGAARMWRVSNSITGAQVLNDALDHLDYVQSQHPATWEPEVKELPNEDADKPWPPNWRDQKAGVDQPEDLTFKPPVRQPTTPNPGKVERKGGLGFGDLGFRGHKFTGGGPGYPPDPSRSVSGG